MGFNQCVVQVLRQAMATDAPRSITDLLLPFHAG